MKNETARSRVVRKSIAASLLMLSLVLGGAVLVSPVQAVAAPATPIQHLVVIYDENISFDHYFATYPNAMNPPGEPQFIAAPNTPAVNNLNGPLLTSNPNLVNPYRLDRSQAITCDNDNGYTAEQQAVDGGLMDKFVQATGVSTPGCSPNLVMGYYDGNTVTGIWNLAQNFAMSDNFYGTNYGGTLEGHLNLVSGDTSGAVASPAGATTPDIANGAIVANIGSTYDDCASGAVTASMTGQNVGNLLDKAGVTWGYFQGGFAPSSVSASGKATCASTHTQFNGTVQADYSANQNPFLFYQSTTNQHHLPPTSIANVGKQDQANHLYDLTYFFNATAAGNLPAVSFLKPYKYQSGHGQYSDPLDEQTWLANTVNYIEKLPQWSSTAIIITYDDSDGWYDHQMAPVVTPSSDPAQDALFGSSCGTLPVGAQNDQCGYGMREPFLVISPYAKQNFVDHTLTDQSSVLKFIEDNWSLGRIGGHSTDVKAGSILNMFNFASPPRTGSLVLDPTTGLVVSNTLSSAVPPPSTGPSTVTSTFTSTVSVPTTVTSTSTSLSTATSTATVTSTNKVTSTATATATTTATTTTTSISVSTTTQSNSSISSLAFAAMGALLVVGVGVGLVVGRRRPSA